MHTLLGPLTGHLWISAYEFSCDWWRFKARAKWRKSAGANHIRTYAVKTCAACGSWSLMLNFVSWSFSPNPQIVSGMFGIRKSIILQASCSLLNSGMSTSLQHSIDFNSPFRSSCIESKISEGYMFCNVLHVSQKLFAMERANSSKGCSMNKHSKSQSLWGSGRTISCFVPSSRNSEKTRICWLRPIGISWTFT